MKYAIWNLSQNDGLWFGPEDKLRTFGIEARASFTGPDNDSDRLAFLSEECDESAFQEFNLRFITQEQALAFAQDIDESAVLLDSGEIVSVSTDYLAS